MYAEGKRVDLGPVCKEQEIDIRALNETKLKGVKRRMVWKLQKGLVSGVNERVWARGDVAIVMKEELCKYI